MKYEYPKNVDVLSGFGANSGYELQCQKMVIVGMEWFDKNPKADPKFKGFKDVYGLLMEDNKDAKLLSKAITEGTDCTGAMHQASINHIFYAHKNGWDKYIAKVTKSK